MKFSGQFTLDRPLTVAHLRMLENLSTFAGAIAPSKYCDWTPTEDGTGIKWNGREEFYCHTEWLEIIAARYLQPLGYILNGEVQWLGDEPGEYGTIRVVNNEIINPLDRE